MVGIVDRKDDFKRKIIAVEGNNSNEMQVNVGKCNFEGESNSLDCASRCCLFDSMQFSVKPQDYPLSSRMLSSSTDVLN